MGHNGVFLLCLGCYLLLSASLFAWFLTDYSLDGVQDSEEFGLCWVVVVDAGDQLCRS
jgi:hypothetical protein